MPLHSKWGYRYKTEELPDDRDACRRCLNVKARTGSLPKHCGLCLWKNPEFMTDDLPMIVKAQKIVDERIRKVEGGLEYSRNRTLFQTRKGGGYNGLNPEQRKIYHAALSKMLARAEANGKRTDGNHLNPYRLRALQLAYHPHKNFTPDQKRVRRAKRLLHRFRTAKMAKEAGILDRSSKAVPIKWLTRSEYEKQVKAQEAQASGDSEGQP